MLKQRLILALLLTACFTLAIWLQSAKVQQDGSVGASGSFLALILGDGRKLFANEMFAKSDAYFHRGNYPSIFDLNARKEENHMSSEAGHDDHGGGREEDHHEDDRQSQPRPRDWIEALGLKFRGASHMHLEKGEEREMLPWLRFTAELDPSKIEAFTVTAYWLRRLKKVDEAEQFLREGLRNNPRNPDILNELAWLYFEDRKDSNRAKNLWLAALRRWEEFEKSKEKPDNFLRERILGGLAQAESELGQNEAAVNHLKQLKEISPHPDAIQKWIEKLRSREAVKPVK